MSVARSAETIGPIEEALDVGLDRIFERVHKRYERLLRGSLNYLSVTLVFVSRPSFEERITICNRSRSCWAFFRRDWAGR